MGAILGISAGTHDAAVAAINNGEILYAAHSERYSQNKSDANLNPDIIAAATAALPKWEYFRSISYYERPWIRYARQLYTGEKFTPTKNDFSIKSMLDDKMKKLPIHYHNHHLSHAAAGFQTSPYYAATCIIIDAIGEFDCITIWDARYNYDGEAQYTKLWSKTYPNSIGLLYSAATARAGLLPMDEEYILMGMAAYGKPIHYDTIRALMDNEFNFKENLHTGFPEEFLAGANKYDLAASVQVVTEELLVDVFRLANKIGRSNNIVYGGGCALNCVANNKLLSECDRLWIMPCPGDAGAALGAAALDYKQKLNWRGPYLGEDINGFNPYPVEELLKELLKNQIAGVAHGRAEFGPRALGNRSLFADPRGEDIKYRVNTIKRRQKFRPFAPVILEKYANDYFFMPSQLKGSPYMQHVATCKDPKAYPAIVHADQTSRVQTVNMDQHPGLYILLAAWHEKTGCPMLLNTSLNIRGKPMVNNIADAMSFQYKYDIKVCRADSV